MKTETLIILLVAGAGLYWLLKPKTATAANAPLPQLNIPSTPLVGIPGLPGGLTLTSTMSQADLDRLQTEAALLAQGYTPGVGSDGQPLWRPPGGGWD